MSLSSAERRAEGTRDMSRMEITNTPSFARALDSGLRGRLKTLGFSQIARFGL
jgi:hypothetical protein